MITETTRALTQSLPLVEAFYTIQGEGHHQGKAAYFIRLGGCDVGCVWCDVKESWDASVIPMFPFGKWSIRRKKISGQDRCCYRWRTTDA